EQWTGSGSVVHVGQKLIVTNNHVVNGESQLQVVFPRRDERGDVIPDKTYYAQLLRQRKSQTARVLHADKGRDLAVLKLEGALPPDTVAIKVAPVGAKPADRI